MNNVIPDSSAIKGLVPTNPGDYAGVKILKTGEPMFKASSDGIKYSKRIFDNGGTFQTLYTPPGKEIIKSNINAIEGVTNVTSSGTANNSILSILLNTAIQAAPYIIGWLYLHHQVKKIEKLSKAQGLPVQDGCADSDADSKQGNEYDSVNSDNCTYDDSIIVSFNNRRKNA